MFLLLLPALLLLQPVLSSELGGVHAAFYLWYGNPEEDGAYQHWDHEVLPHWTQAIRDRYTCDVSPATHPCSAAVAAGDIAWAFIRCHCDYKDEQ